MITNNRTLRALFLASTVILLSGCSKKPERETVPVTADTLSETTDTLLKTTDTLSKTTDTVSETHDTLSVTTNTLPIKFYTLTDPRDGKTYRTVKIGKQTWMAENLNYKPKTGKSRCYKDSNSYCEEYGRLYDWETAKKACPEGWHLPTIKEWYVLIDYTGDATVAGKKLKSKNGWNSDENKGDGNGSDDFGFSALPSGTCTSLNSGCGEAGNYGIWWTPTETNCACGDCQCVHCITMGYNDTEVDRIIAAKSYNIDENEDGLSHGYSVRCVRNARPRKGTAP
jgi:uncharacterized protein (TIGR02145 family)